MQVTLIFRCGIKDLLISGLLLDYESSFLKFSMFYSMFLCAFLFRGFYFFGYLRFLSAFSLLKKTACMIDGHAWWKFSIKRKLCDHKLKLGFIRNFFLKISCSVWDSDTLTYTVSNNKNNHVWAFLQKLKNDLISSWCATTNVSSQRASSQDFSPCLALWTET